MAGAARGMRHHCQSSRLFRHVPACGFVGARARMAAGRASCRSRCCTRDWSIAGLMGSSLERVRPDWLGRGRGGWASEQGV